MTLILPSLMFDMDCELVIAVVFVTTMFWPVFVLLYYSFFVFFLPSRTCVPGIV